MARTMNVIPSREARQHLGTMLKRFRAGQWEPMYFGAHRKPEAVILPFDEYERLLDVQDAYAQQREDELADEVRRRLASDTASVEMSLEELAGQLGTVGAEWLRERGGDVPRSAHG